MAKFEFSGKPMTHQVNLVRKAWPQPEMALFWEPGAGKTYATINLAMARFLHDQIDLVVVISPNSVKQVWGREAEKFCTVSHRVQILDAGKTIKPNPAGFRGLEFLVLAVEALSQGSTYNKVMEYIKGRKAMCIMDESSRIKNSKSIRTKKATAIGWSCFYRLILTGTEVTQGIHDLFAQMRFLDPNIIGCKNFTAFKAKYCEMGGYQGKKIVGYSNVDQLMDKIRPFCDIIKLKDVADIPAKIYKRLIVEPTPQQRKAIRELRSDGETAFINATGNSVDLAVNMALERMTRIQQIIGGNYAYATEDGYKTEPMPGGSPKLDALIDFINEDLPEGKKMLIWARFTPERDQILEAIESRVGPGQCVVMDGRTNKDDRVKAVDLFQDPNSGVRFFIGNQTVAGIGLTLTQGTYAFTYSNTFSAEDRIQMENRNHRTGQKEHCIYVDCEMSVREDTMILKAVDGKIDLAKAVRAALESGEKLFSD